jgi:Fe-S-cluster-containing hydrogenase component 2
VIFEEKKCIKCGVCAEACSYGAINIHFETGKPLKCDLCGGHPVCQEYCNRNAIKFEEALDEVEIKKNRFFNS